MIHPKTIAIDVDGVINSYVSGWTGPDSMPDAPNPGAMNFLKGLVDDARFEPVVVSSRLNSESGLGTVVKWLRQNLRRELGPEEGDRVMYAVGFSVKRPPATVSIDDRALCFDGTWPSLDSLATFQPWNKKPATVQTVETTADEWHLISDNPIPTDDTMIIVGAYNGEGEWWSDVWVGSSLVREQEKWSGTSVRVSPWLSMDPTHWMLHPAPPPAPIANESALRLARAI